MSVLLAAIVAVRAGLLLHDLVDLVDDEPAAAPEKTHAVRVEVTGRAATAAIIQLVGAHPAFVAQPVLPWSAEFPIPASRYQTVEVIAHASLRTEVIGCSITIDGEVRNEATGNGSTTCQVSTGESPAPLPVPPLYRWSPTPRAATVTRRAAPGHRPLWSAVRD